MDGRNSIPENKKAEENPNKQWGQGSWFSYRYPPQVLRQNSGTFSCNILTIFDRGQSLCRSLNLVSTCCRQQKILSNVHRNFITIHNFSQIMFWQYYNRLPDPDMNINFTGVFWWTKTSTVKTKNPSSLQDPSLHQRGWGEKNNEDNWWALFKRVIQELLPGIEM